MFNNGQVHPECVNRQWWQKTRKLRHACNPASECSRDELQKVKNMRGQERKCEGKVWAHQDMLWRNKRVQLSQYVSDFPKKYTKMMLRIEFDIIYGKFERNSKENLLS